MVLSDWEIVQAILNEEVIITPLMDVERQIGSCSIDVRLGTEFKIIKIVKRSHFDLSASMDMIRKQIGKYTELIHVQPMEPFILHPQEFALASTLEYIKLSDSITARLEGRSTWGRAGLQVHSTAGLVDAGYEGTLTFELHNMGKLPLPLYPGIRIAQLIFYRCLPVMKKYIEKRDAKFAKSIRIKDTTFYQEYEYKQILKSKSKTRTHASEPQNSR